MPLVLLWLLDLFLNASSLFTLRCYSLFFFLNPPWGFLSACNESAYSPCVSIYSILLGQAFCEKFHFFHPSQFLFPLFIFSPSSSQIELCSLRLLLRSWPSPPPPLPFFFPYTFLVRLMTACTTRSASCVSPRLSIPFFRHDELMRYLI